MASKFPAGSKRPRDGAVQGLKVKFLINIPLKVDSVAQAQGRYGYLLNQLQSQGFREEDQKFVREKNGKEVLEDVAVVFGLNGKYTPQLEKVLEELKTSRHDCKINYSLITYTWGSGGMIAPDAMTPPYQEIREYLKKEAVKLVKDFRGKDPSCLVYFSFVDSDTVHFNYIYSEYLQIVKDELRKDNVPPTVMSTGYEFNRNSEHHIASWHDRMVRAAVAEVHPLLVYYPEPNFCVLVCNGLDKFEETFIKEGRTADEYSMESPVLIRQVKKRENFKAVFSPNTPIIIEVPERFRLSLDGLKTNQSHMIEMNLAKGALCNGVLTNAQTYTKGEGPNNPVLVQGVAGINRGFIIDVFNCKDEKKLKELRKKNPYTIDNRVATVLVEAITNGAKAYRKFVYDMDQKMCGGE